MADNADIAAGIIDDTVANAVRHARNLVLAGTAGECEECEWWMPRLVGGLCGFCRDGRPRPPDWEPPPRPDAIATEPPEEKLVMPAKSVQLPASAVVAIAAIEAHAAEHEVSFGLAAATLIERGLAAPDAGPEQGDDVPVSTSRQRMFAALDQVAAIAAELLDRPADAATLAEAIKRAEAAENEAESLRELLAEATSRANRFATKLDELRAALS